MSKRAKAKICLMDIESTSLDADTGTFIGGGLMELDGRFTWFYSKTPRNEKEALSRFLKRLSTYNVVVTWNGRFFDVPFLTARALKHGIAVEFLHKLTHVDLAEFIKTNLRLARSDLYHVAKFLNVKKDLSVEGFDVPALYLRAMKGDRRAALRIKNHCKDDLEVTRRIFKKVLPILRLKYPDLLA